MFTVVEFIISSNIVALTPVLLSINSIVLSMILILASALNKLDSISPLASFNACADQLTLGCVGEPNALSLWLVTAVSIIARFVLASEPSAADAFAPVVV